jgi:hypothetical protein
LAPVVAGDAVLDLASESFHAGEEFLFGSFVPLLNGCPLAAFEAATCQKFGCACPWQHSRIRDPQRVAEPVKERAGHEQQAFAVQPLGRADVLGQLLRVLALHLGEGLEAGGHENHPGMLVGAGRVLTPRQPDAAVSARAFLVSPGVTPQRAVPHAHA